MGIRWANNTTTNKSIRFPTELYPKNVEGNVLSLIANKANKGRLPTSATTLFSDMSRYGNDCTLNNLAGSAASGFNTEVNANSGKTVSFLRLDGSDDYGAFANVPSLDITTNEFALACTFRITSGAASSYLICKNGADSANTQYAIYYNSGGNSINIDLNSGTDRCPITVAQNTWYNLIYYRNSSGLIKGYLNKVVGNTATYANELVTQTNPRLGARSSNAGGTTHSNYFKGDIATQSIYQATTLDINRIIKAEMNISRAYTGVS